MNLFILNLKGYFLIILIEAWNPSVRLVMLFTSFYANHLISAGHAVTMPAAVSYQETSCDLFASCRLWDPRRRGGEVDESRGDCTVHRRQEGRVWITSQVGSLQSASFCLVGLRFERLTVVYFLQRLVDPGVTPQEANSPGSSVHYGIVEVKLPCFVFDCI